MWLPADVQTLVHLHLFVLMLKERRCELLDDRAFGHNTFFQRPAPRCSLSALDRQRMGRMTNSQYAREIATAEVISMLNIST